MEDLAWQEALESQHRLSTMILVEAEDGAMEEAVVEEDQVDSSKFSKITRLQKIQVVVEEEETLEEGGAQEEELDGNKDKTIILMYVGHAVNMGTTQMNAIIGKMIGIHVETNKGIMN